MKKLVSLAVLLLLMLTLAACTQNGNEKEQQNEEEQTEGMDHSSMGNDEQKSDNNNSLVNSTKNVTRLDVNNAVNAAVKVSQTVWPATQDDNKPKTVILVPTENWQVALASTDLIHHPNNGPVLFYEKDQIPEVTLNEIERLDPLGVEKGTEVMVMGDPAQKILDQLKDYSIQQIKGTDPVEFAAKVDEAYADAAGELPQSVIVVSAEEEAKLYSLIAANWIAHMPEPVLFVTKGGVPETTKDALNKRFKKANIYLLAPESVVSNNIEESLGEFGTVTRIEGKTPVDTSIAFAKFKDEKTGFGWGLTEPGHGLVFTSTENAEFTAAGAPFAHLGKHAPLIWLENGELADETHEFLAQIQPKFKDDPTVGPYNHAFILGSGDAVSMSTQGMIDQMLEITSEDGGGHGGH